MKLWNITKLSKNNYLITSTRNDNFIKVLLSTELPGDPEILLNDTRDMSPDHVIFYPKAYETPENDIPIIGEAYQYDGMKCIGKELVSVFILCTNIPKDAKTYIELLCS